MPLSRQAWGRIDRLVSPGRNTDTSAPPPAPGPASAPTRSAATRGRHHALDDLSDYLARLSNRRLATGGLVATLVVLLGAFGLGQLDAGGQQAPPPTETVAASMAPVAELPPASYESPLVLGTAGIGSVWGQLAEPVGDLPATAAGEFANPAPSSLASEPPIGPDEVFGVVPYWALAHESALDVKGLTTVVYAGLQINPDGSIQSSGSAWNAYVSQDFVNLIDTAHADGVRVVVSVYDYDQNSLNQLSTNPTAPNQLAQSLLFLVKMRDLDGVNLDLEGQGSQDQAGITNLVGDVSQTLKAANPHYQVTVDTNASSAGSANGIDNLAALNGSVDAFLVTEDQLNLAAIPSSTSAMTSAGESLQATLNEYLSEVPASKVIAVLPLFGLEWPTTDGTLQAKPVGSGVAIPATALRAGQAASWDPVTQTAWTSFQVANQWHEVFYETPRSLRLATRTAQANGIAGVGVWGLGTDGTDARIVSALRHPPAQAAATSGAASPDASSSESGPSSTSTTTPTTTSTTSAARRQGGTPATTTTSAPSTPAASASPSASSSPTFSGVWIDSRTDVLPTAVPSGQPTEVGVMSGFTTNYPGLTCLNHEQFLDVYVIAGHPGDFYVIAQTGQGDCMNAAFVFYDPDSPIGGEGS